MKKDYAKEIIKEVDAAARTTDRRNVFRDFCCAMAIALESEPVARFIDPERHKRLEAEYAAIAGRYAGDMAKAEHVLSVVVEALEDTGTDVLGHVYEELNATNKHFGQFFTPTDVSRLMSSVALADHCPELGRIVTVNDPACGAGVLLIECVNAFINKGGRQGDIMVYAEDIDRTAADICYIQLSLLGIPAQVTRMDTLSLKGDEPRLTIGYYLHNVGPRLASQRDEAKAS